MKRKYIIVIIALIAGLSSCVEDKGSNFYTEINELTISGIEKEYNKIAYVETLSIKPNIESSLTKQDENQLEYQWFICNDSPTDEQHTVISTEKDLEFPLDLAPGTYSLYFEALDKTTGLKWKAKCTLNTISQFVRGFYLFGDKEDGTCGMDFVSMMAGIDTTVVENIFVNSLKIKEAQDLVFTGAYNEVATSLWAITKSGSYSIEYSSSKSEFDIRTEVSADKFIYPTIEVTRPLKVMNIFPHAFGSTNINLARSSRVLMTENEFFTTSLYNDPEAYGNPLSRYSSQTSELFKPSQYVFYPGNASYISRIVFYDETNQRFIGLNSSYSFASNSIIFKTDDGAIFFFDQTKYTPVRSLIYGENGFGNAGRSYALMTDANKNFYIYGFTTSGSTPIKVFNRNIDQTVATDFAKASHYACFSMQTVLLYSVGSQLWAYDYTRNEAKMVKDFNSEITYLAMDYNSNDTPTDFILATYSPSEKGVVHKFTIVDDQNKIEVIPHEKEVWKTSLKVAKVEYRNASI